MTDAVEIALIGAAAVIVPAVGSIFAAIYSKRASNIASEMESKIIELDVKVDGRLTQLLNATNAQGRQDERDSQSITVRGVPEEPKK
jgi:hypothetical protein